MEILTILGVTSIVSFLDIDKSFQFPKATKAKIAISSYIGLYIVLNSVLCYLLYLLAESSKAINLPAGIGLALTVSFAFPLLLKSKIITYKQPGSETSIPIGLDAFHESIKSFIYRQVNGVSKRYIEEELAAIASGSTLPDLITKVKNYILLDGLLSDSEKQAEAIWLQQTIANQSLLEPDKKIILCWYLRTGKKAAS